MLTTKPIKPDSQFLQVFINAVKNAILASRSFQKELVSPGATVESVMHKLGVKQMAAQEFEESLGIPWLL